MANHQRFSTGLLVEQWSNGTQSGDPTPVGHTTWDAQGLNPVTVALTAAESSDLASADATQTSRINQANIQAAAQNALAAAAQDQTQDQAIITQAAAITAASITNLAAGATAIAKLAQAVSVLAQNDLNRIAVQDGLIRMALQQFNATT